MAAKKTTKKKAVKKQVKKVVMKSATQTMPVFNQGLPVNSMLPTLFSDTVESIYRTDGLLQLRFFSKEPGETVEQSRITIPIKTLEGIIDNYCRFSGFKPNQKK